MLPLPHTALATAMVMGTGTVMQLMMSTVTVPRKPNALSERNEKEKKNSRR